MRLLALNMRTVLLNRSCMNTLAVTFGNIVQRLMALAVDANEFACLRFISLFSSGQFFLFRINLSIVREDLLM
jgi:hypothetical protein